MKRSIIAAAFACVSLSCAYYEKTHCTVCPSPAETLPGAPAPSLVATPRADDPDNIVWGTFAGDSTVLVCDPPGQSGRINTPVTFTAAGATSWTSTGSPKAGEGATAVVTWSVPTTGKVIFRSAGRMSVTCPVQIRASLP